jgi:AcrR family transcriptional regulator
MTKRRYRMDRREAQRAETRRRIIEATAELHEEVGPAATTISAVAERAGVQRLTVYRHFPDDAALIAACSAHAGELHPPPDPALWSGIADPAERLEAALRALYAYYARRERAIAQVLRDAERVPALRAALEPMEGYMGMVAAGLAEGWSEAPRDPRLFRAALGHALDFWTWRSLASRGLAPEEAAGLIAEMVGR